MLSFKSYSAPPPHKAKVGYFKKSQDSSVSPESDLFTDSDSDIESS